MLKTVSLFETFQVKLRQGISPENPGHIQSILELDSLVKCNFVITKNIIIFLRTNSNLIYSTDLFYLLILFTKQN